MFVHVTTTPNSPRQVVESIRLNGKVSQKIVRHIGIAVDEGEDFEAFAFKDDFFNK